MNSNPDVESKNAKTMQQTDVKCPSCSAAISFDPSSGKLTCEYCGSSFDIPTDNSKDDDVVYELDFEKAEQTGNHDWGVEKKSVVCKACAGESIYDALEIADICPYCGSNQVMEAGAADALAPNGVVTFAITAKQAFTNFKSWLGKKIFTPRKAKESAKPEAFKGVYLPYWTFDTDTSTIYSARYGIDRTVKNSKGESRTVTDWYHTTGKYDEFIDDELVSGTTRYNSTIMERIKPFNTADSKPYKPEYIAGFASERYSKGIKDSWETAQTLIQQKLRSNITSEIRNQYHADRVDSLKLKTNYSNIKYKYLLLPLWLSSFKYKEKIFQFMVNGQTGKVGGKAPVSPLRVAAAVVIGLIILIGLYYLL